MSETTTPTVDVQMLTDLRQAGASHYFTLVTAIDPDAVEVDRNHVAEKVAMTAQRADPDHVPAALKSMSETAGHFVAALWDGDLAEALYRADGTNKRILIRLFPEDLLLSALAADRGSMESARSWLDPNIERYGWDAE